MRTSNQFFLNIKIFCTKTSKLYLVFNCTFRTISFSLFSGSYLPFTLEYNVYKFKRYKKKNNNVMYVHYDKKVKSFKSIPLTKSFQNNFWQRIIQAIQRCYFRLQVHSYFVLCRLQRKPTIFYSQSCFYEVHFEGQKDIPIFLSGESFYFNFNWVITFSLKALSISH